MAEIDYNFKTSQGFTRGGTTWNTGLIKEPGSLADATTQAVRNAVERLSEALYYVGRTAEESADKAAHRGIRTLLSGPSTETVYYTDGTALGPTSPTSDIVAELDTTDVPEGARVRVGRKDAGGAGRTLTVKNGVGGSSLVVIASGDIGWIEAEMYSGDWIVTAWGGSVVPI